MGLNAFAITSYFKKNIFLFAFILYWSVGFLVGFSFFRTFRPPELFLMRSVLFQPVSIVGLICVIFFPLLCTYISVVLNKPIIVLVISFLKAASFSFSFSLLNWLSGSASWLLCLIWMFSDGCFLLVLFAIWFQYLYFSNFNYKRVFTSSFVFGLLILFGDYFVMSQFLVGVL